MGGAGGSLLAALFCLPTVAAIAAFTLRPCPEEDSEDSQAQSGSEDESQKKLVDQFLQCQDEYRKEEKRKAKKDKSGIISQFLSVQECVCGGFLLESTFDSEPDDNEDEEEEQEG